MGTVLFIAGLYIAMFVIMVANNGWQMAIFLVVVLAAPFVVFGLIPYLLGSRPGCGCNNQQGYFYGYSYKYGAKHPKF